MSEEESKPADGEKEETGKPDPCKLGHRFIIDKSILTNKYGLFGLCQSNNIFILLYCQICGKCADTNGKIFPTQQNN